MNIIYPLEQIFKTGNLDANLISRPYNLDLLAGFMEIKSVNANSKQCEIAKELGCSSSTLKRNRNDENLLSPYRIPSETNKKET